jgi:alpha-ribazole phosphatase
MEVYVIRHTPVAVGKDICYGQSDVPLANTFLQDAAYFRNNLPTNFDSVFCSPSQRCKELATVLKYDNVVYEKALMEMNFGDWENKKWNDLNQDELNHWMTDFVNIKAPNGENLLQLHNRVKVFSDRLLMEGHKKVLLITHAGVIRCLWAYLLEIPLHNIFKIPISHNEIFIFYLTQNPYTDSIIQIK